MAKKKAEKKKEIVSRKKEYMLGRLRNYEKLKRDFLGSEYQSLSEFFEYHVGSKGALSGRMRKSTKGRTDEKQRIVAEAAKKAKERVEQALIDKFTIPESELKEMKYGTLQIVKVFLNGATKEVTTGRGKNKKTKVVLCTTMKELKVAYDIIKVELGEPTNIITNDADAGLNSITVNFGGEVGKSQFIGDLD